MVAISQRSIPKDQLYEKNYDKKHQDTLFCTNTTKISSFSILIPSIINNISPHEQLLHFFPPLETSRES